MHYGKSEVHAENSERNVGREPQNVGGCERGKSGKGLRGADGMMAPVVDDVLDLLIGEVRMVDQSTEIIAVEIEMAGHFCLSIFANLEPSCDTGRHTADLLHLLRTDKTSERLTVTDNASGQDGAYAGNAFEGSGIGGIGIDHRSLGKLFRPLGTQAVIMRLTLGTESSTFRLFLGPLRTACRPYRLTVEPCLVTRLTHSLLSSPFRTTRLVLGMAAGLFGITQCTHAVVESMGIAVEGIVQIMPRTQEEGEGECAKHQQQDACCGLEQIAVTGSTSSHKGWNAWDATGK